MAGTSVKGNHQHGHVGGDRQGQLGAAEHLDIDDGEAPEQRGADDQKRAEIERLEPGPQDHQRAEEADDDRRPAPPAEHLAEHQGAEQRGEQRGGEGERGGAGNGCQRQADEEGQHGEDVEDRAQQMQAQFLRVEQAGALAHQQGQDHDQAEHIAEEGHLGGGHALCRIADGGVHGGEHRRRQHHQQARAGDRREAAAEGRSGAHDRKQSSHAAQPLSVSRLRGKCGQGWLFIGALPRPMDLPPFICRAAPGPWARSAMSVARRRWWARWPFRSGSRCGSSRGSGSGCSC